MAEKLLVVGAHFTRAVEIRQALKGINWYPQTFFATVGPVLQKYQETLGPDVELSFSVSIWEPHENLNFPRSKEFVEAFKKQYKQEPSYHAAAAYTAGQILELAIELAGSLEREGAADKAAIQLVRVQQCQLLVSDT